MNYKKVDLIGAALGWGASRHETQGGPQALQAYGVPLAQINLLLSRLSYAPGKELNYDERLDQIKDLVSRLAERVKISLKQQHFPLVLGGDHSMAIGTWSGVINALQAPLEFGLIWLDAHMDAHTPQTTPSQAIHGMPLAALLGHGDPALVNIGLTGAKLNPQHLVLIGVRSFEAGEAELLKKLKVKVYSAEEVQQRGFTEIFNEALKLVTTGTRGFGVSIDVDVFDPAIAPGTGTPEPNGLQTAEVFTALREINHHPAFKALEIAEFDPTKDIQHKTAQLITQLIASIQEHHHE